MGEHRKSLTRYKIGDMLVNMNTRDDYYGDVIIILDIDKESLYPYKFRSMLDGEQDHCKKEMFKSYEKVENVDEIPYNSQFS